MSKSIRYLVSLASFLAGFWLLTGTAHGIGNTFLSTAAPSAGGHGTGTTAASLVVEYTDAVSVPNLNLKWFISDASTTNPTIVLTGFCAAGNSQAYVQFQKYDQATSSWNMVGQNISNFTAPGFVRLCVGNDLVVGGVANNNFVCQEDQGTYAASSVYRCPNDPSLPNLYPGYRVFLVTVHLRNQTTFGGLTKFNATVSGSSPGVNYITQAEEGTSWLTSTSPPPGGGFAILGDVTNHYGYNATFTFRANCSAFPAPNTTIDIFLHWRDADGWASYGNQTRWELWDTTSGTRNTTVGPGLALGATSNSSESIKVTLDYGHTYEWRWINVNHLNTIHLWMPFSEAVTDTPACGTLPVQCTQLSAPATVNVGDVFNVTVRLRNVSGAAVGAANASSGYHLGVINQTGRTPPDYPNGGVWQPINGVTNLTRYNVPAGAQTIQRMFITRGIVNNGTTLYTFSVTAGSTGSAGSLLGVRVLDRTSGVWYPLEAACQTSIVITDAHPFTIEAHANQPILDNADAPTKVTYSGYFVTTDPSGSVTSINNVSTPTSLYRLRGGVRTNMLNPTSINTTRNLTIVPGTTNTTVFTYTIPGGFPAFVAGDQICFDISATPRAGDVDSSGNILPGATGTSTDTSCISILDLTYMRVYGGEVIAGTSFAKQFGDTCTAQTGNIKGYVRSSGANYAGAGSQYAAFANNVGTIQGFATAMLFAPSAPSTLAFANTGVSGTTFGTAFKGQFCEDAYWPATFASPTVSSTFTLDGSTSGVYKLRPAATDTAVTIDQAASITQSTSIYVDGDVYIASQLTTPTTWSLSGGKPNIPVLKIVARGNIYIQANVPQIDATLIAVPTGFTAGGGAGVADTLTNGIIYTCYNNSGTTTDTWVYSQCNTKLTIHGSLIAANVRFLRSRGKLRNATVGEAANSNNIAEVIQVTPETYVGTPADDPIPTVGKYDSILTLQPSL